MPENSSAQPDQKRRLAEALVKTAQSLIFEQLVRHGTEKNQNAYGEWKALQKRANLFEAEIYINGAAPEVPGSEDAPIPYDRIEEYCRFTDSLNDKILAEKTKVV